MKGDRHDEVDDRSEETWGNLFGCQSVTTLRPRFAHSRLGSPVGSGHGGPEAHIP